ncbi:hypothetical protein AC579_6103 [Pseudocercospora musae]|uniref:Carboxylic ester hydrolase n=1 Tax=Pseudocercospora musae TaxID=113226 RepID=A0A139I755_9PEZI|nr:hypothetical protein AC579_6103 [Pseudocercospora musae]
MAESQIALGAMRLTGPSAAVLTASNLVDGSLSSRCASSRLSQLDVFGAKILAVTASPLQNHTAVTDAGIWSDLNICNVTVTYTHPGRDDTIHIDIWLPLEDWNGRFQGAGGGGWAMGPSIDKLASAASQGFSVARTDGGHDLDARSDPEFWALDSPGNVNLNLLQDFASLALYDLANIGKQITANFYGTPAKKSYWNGCSTGGRQGLMLAQRYPDAFDGILAIAPAVHWAHFLVAEYWPQQVMNRLGHYPPPCVFEAINQAAIKACDSLDGVVDGIISDPRICDFDATTVVGKSINCNGTQLSISKEAAMIANATWSGARDPSGKFNWYGLAKGTPFYNASTSGLVGTNCTDSSAPSCTGAPFPISRDWIKYFVYKDPKYPVENMTDAEFFATMHKSVQEYESIISASDPDLSPFRNVGGKMITWHGLSDQLIFPDGIVEYYEKVLKLDPAAKDFYRFFEAPGVEHCSGGVGPLPNGALSDLIRWVEEEDVPETLLALSQNGGKKTRRKLCSWPKKQKYIGGDPDQEESFTCV